MTSTPNNSAAVWQIREEDVSVEVARALGFLLAPYGEWRTAIHDVPEGDLKRFLVRNSGGKLWFLYSPDAESYRVPQLGDEFDPAHNLAQMWDYVLDRLGKSTDYRPQGHETPEQRRECVEFLQDITAYPKEAAALRACGYLLELTDSQHRRVEIIVA